MANPIYRQIAGDLRAQIASGDLAAGSRPVELQLATEQVAGDLGIARSSEVISRHERRFIGWHPWSIQTWYYPMGFVDRGAERLRSAPDIPEGTVKYLADKLRIRQSGYRDWITVRAPNLTEAGFFKISADGQIPVFEIFRTAFDQDGRAIRITIHPERRSARRNSISPIEVTKGGHMDKIQHLLDSRSAVIRHGQRPEGER
jgi:DNA-binding GntR family transcriptional regulator